MKISTMPDVMYNVSYYSDNLQYSSKHHWKLKSDSWIISWVAGLHKLHISSSLLLHLALVKQLQSNFKYQIYHFTISLLTFRTSVAIAIFI